MATDHFDLYYYGANPLVWTAAFWVEEAYNELEQKFNYTLDHRVPLVLYSSHIHFQQTNVLPMRIPEGIGGFFELIKGRVVLPFNGNLHDFRHVLRHELVHVFMQNKVHAAINDAVLSGGIATKAAIPMWVMMVGAVGIALGLALYGPKLIRTVGSEITELDKMRAYCVAMAAAITVIIASQLGLPVSSTHIAVGGVFGVGFLREYLEANHARMLDEIREHHL